MSFSSSYGSPLYVPWEFYFNMHYSYPPCSYNSYMPFSPRYFCSDYITYKELAIKKSQPINKDCFNHKNLSVQKKKYEVTDALLYPKSKRTLLSFKDIRLNGFHVETETEKGSEYLLITKFVRF